MVRRWCEACGRKQVVKTSIQKNSCEVRCLSCGAVHVLKRREDGSNARDAVLAEKVVS